MAPNLINKNSQCVKLVKRNLLKYNKELKKQYTEYQKFIKNNFEYVGENFAYEARSIHYMKKKRKRYLWDSIKKRFKGELKEEGIDTETDTLG